MKTLRGFVAGLLVMATLVVLGQSSVQNPGLQVQDYAITNFPLYGSLAAKSDSVNFPTPRALRANAAGDLVVSCWSGSVGNSITITLAAGEFVPCQARRLWSTGSDAITVHMFY